MEKLHVFDKNGLNLATKKSGKNNPKEEHIQSDNEIRMKWNQEIDRAIVSEVPEDEIRQIKKEYITDRIKSSIEAYGNRPERFQKEKANPHYKPKDNHFTLSIYRVFFFYSKNILKNPIKLCELKEILLIFLPMVVQYKLK